MTAAAGRVVAALAAPDRAPAAWNCAWCRSNFFIMAAENFPKIGLTQDFWAWITHEVACGVEYLIKRLKSSMLNIQ